MTSRVLLMSGGLDSAALAWHLRPDLALTIDYGHRAFAGELRAATALCAASGIKQEVVHADLRSFGSGDLAGTPPIAVAPASDWWPFRNQMLLTVAAMHLLGRGAAELVIGTVRTDQEHADGRPDFVRRMADVFACQEGGITVSAPAVDLTTVELVRLSGIPTNLLHFAHSCHRHEWACGECRGCIKYQVVMNDLGLI